VLIDELLEHVEVHGDHLEVSVRGAPKLNITLAEAGLDEKCGERSCRRTELLSGPDCDSNGQSCSLREDTLDHPWVEHSRGRPDGAAN
jgi:hypothetical protein